MHIARMLKKKTGIFYRIRAPATSTRNESDSERRELAPENDHARFHIWDYVTSNACSMLSACVNSPSSRPCCGGWCWVEICLYSFWVKSPRLLPAACFACCSHLSVRMLIIFVRSTIPNTNGHSAGGEIVIHSPISTLISWFDSYCTL